MSITSKDKEILICINSPKGNHFFAQFEPFRDSLAMTTHSPVVAQQMLENGYNNILLLDLENKEQHKDLFQAHYQKIIIIEGNILECGLAVDVCKSYTKGPIYVVRTKKRFVHPRLYQSIGASYVIFTNNENDITFIFK
ncbi:hypothetical protein [Halalkalibacter alkalisediminis]|uniref:Uncharacterized protein n=1 Tax=Halalkalibacter alkalisediminis TaxID=935616 RepID=A0ABV6NMI6_9BACI|nr:hypothetical protein [Halalkalibacter alkalisediminis]